MRISLVSKGDAGNTCPYCRDTIESGEGRRCNGCKTTLHRECADELHKCPTTGCGRSLTQRAPSAGRRADRVMIGGRNRTQNEMSPTAQKALGAAVLVVMLIGVWVAIPSTKTKRSSKGSSRRSGVVTAVFGQDQDVIHQHMPKYVVSAGPAWQLQLTAREHDGTRLKIVIEAGTTFALNGGTRPDYVALRRTVLLIQNEGRRYNFPVAPLQPEQWREKPPGHYQPTAPDSSPASTLGKAWKTKRVGAPLEVEAVAALWYLGFQGQLRPTPGEELVAPANRVLRQLGHEPVASAPTPATTPRSAPRTTSPRISPAVRYLLRQYAFHPTRRVNFRTAFRHARADPHAQALVLEYLKSELEPVRWEAFRWLAANLVDSASDQALHARLLDRDRQRRLLALSMLIRRGRKEYAPLELIYARDAWVDPQRYGEFVRTWRDMAPRLAAGESPYRLHVQRVGVSVRAARQWRGLGQRLVEDEERYVAQVMRKLQPGTGARRSMRSFSQTLGKLAARFRHHPLLWARLHELCGDSSPWVRQLALNAASRLAAGGRILAKAVDDRRYPVAARLEAIHHTRYVSVLEALRVAQAAARGPKQLQAAVIPVIRARRAQLNSQAVKTEAGKVLASLIASPYSDVAQGALALLVEFELPGVRAALARTVEIPVQAERVIPTVTAALTAHSELARAVAGDLRGWARSHEEARVRRAALRGASVYAEADRKPFRALLEHVVANDTASLVRIEAVRIAAKHPDRYLSLLLGRLADGDATVRRAAVTGLRRNTRGSVHRRIQKLATHDADRGVRRAAYDAVRHWSSSQARLIARSWAKRRELDDQRLAVTVMIRDFPTDKRIRAKLRSFERHSDAWIRNAVRVFFQR